MLMLERYSEITFGRLGWVMLFDLNGETRMFEGDSWILEAGIEARQAEKRRLLTLLSS